VLDALFHDEANSIVLAPAWTDPNLVVAWNGELHLSNRIPPCRMDEESYCLTGTLVNEHPKVGYCCRWTTK